MNEKNQHGSIFKQLREERGYKLKDVAGDVISTRTLLRFEADETSISIAVFEKLLKNCGIEVLDYLVYYYDKVNIELSEFTKKLNECLRTGSPSKVVTECKKELKKNSIELSERLSILMALHGTNWKEDKVFDNNKRIIRETIESTNKLGWNEISGLRFLIDYASREDYSVEYIDRIIEDCLQNIPVRNYLSQYVGVLYCDLLHASLAFLSRNGYYDLAEKRCKNTLDLYYENPFLLNRESLYFDVIGILAKVYLRQNKKEGVELANKVLKYKNIIAETTDDSWCKQLMEINYKSLCEVNKTGIDFEF